MVDTELYFLFVLKKIEENGWNAVNGIVEAVTAMIGDGETGAMNFIMSDGETLWAFRKGNTLYYLDATANPANGYAAVASAVPAPSRATGIDITTIELVVLTRNAAPVVINNVTNLLPRGHQQRRAGERHGSGGLCREFRPQRKRGSRFRRRRGRRDLAVAGGLRENVRMSSAGL